MSDLRHSSPAESRNDHEPQGHWLARAWRAAGAPFRRIRWPRGPKAWALWIAGGLAGTAGLIVAAFFLVIAAYKPDLPFSGDLYALNRPPAFIFQDTKGQRLGRSGANTGERLRLSDMPSYLPAAFLAMEDRRFYDHRGIDYRGFIRAAYANIRAGRIVQGGSTITQQLAKALFLSPRRTIERKLEEMAVARELEARFSKDEILELYLNRIYLGSGAYGVDGAARVYFGKSARNVTLAEAAMLASLTRAPSVFSPKRDLAAAQARSARVLRAMVETGAITPAQADAARANPAEVFDQSLNVTRNYFFDAAAEEAQRLLPKASGDLVIVTTMDPKLQEAANEALTRVLSQSGREARASQGALVAMRTDGAVLAIVGGRDYADSAFNRATQARRQAGSAFKPFVYLTAFEDGLEPFTIRNDRPITVDDYKPENYGRSYEGPMTLHRALVRSVNTIAVQLLTEVSAESVILTARRLGVASPLRVEPSLALGSSEVSPLELAGAYGAFPTGGLRVDPHMVLEVRSITGRLLYRREQHPQRRVIDEKKAQWMNAILYDVAQWGTGAAARVPGHQVAGKTGTTSEFRDAWFVGYSARLVTGVWVGNDDFTPMRDVTGGEIPAKIWSRFMRAALKGERSREIPRKLPPSPIDVAFVTATAAIAIPPGLVPQPPPIGGAVTATPPPDATPAGTPAEASGAVPAAPADAGAPAPQSAVPNPPPANAVAAPPDAPPPQPSPEPAPEPGTSGGT
jgi:penicillin-binding protein 1A